MPQHDWVATPMVGVSDAGDVTRLLSRRVAACEEQNACGTLLLVCGAESVASRRRPTGTVTQFVTDVVGPTGRIGAPTSHDHASAITTRGRIWDRARQMPPPQPGGTCLSAIQLCRNRAMGVVYITPLQQDWVVPVGRVSSGAT